MEEDREESEREASDSSERADTPLWMPSRVSLLVGLAVSWALSIAMVVIGVFTWIVIWEREVQITEHSNRIHAIEKAAERIERVEKMALENRNEAERRRLETENIVKVLNQKLDAILVALKK